MQWCSLTALIERHGGARRSRIDGYLEAYVPATALADLAKIQGLTWAREFAEPVRNRGQVTSGGVAAHLADAGITGTSVNVGESDASGSFTSTDGSSGLQALTGTSIPSIVLGHCYTDIAKPTSNIDNCAGQATIGMSGAGQRRRTRSRSRQVRRWWPTAMTCSRAKPRTY